MPELVLIRHGESDWNEQNRFTGWADVDLTAKGVAQARAVGRTLLAAGFSFDVAYTSVLKRTIRSQWLMFDEMDLMWVPIVPTWRLNERHYGALTGLDKKEAELRYGAQQIRTWRRSFSDPPPVLSLDDQRTFFDDPRYRELQRSQIPFTESLKDVVERVLPFWNETIAPAVLGGKRVVIQAHGNSIRALMKYLDDMTDDAVAALEIPNGTPIIYELDDGLRAQRHYYIPASSGME
jgi:2,3-bisphosphoglycerate-dependent phosphoglycerate mutase